MVILTTKSKKGEDNMKLKELAEKAQREYPELGLTYVNLRTLKFRKIINGEKLYEQAIIALFLKKMGFLYRDIREARDYWLEQKRDEKHLISILLSLGVGYQRKGLKTRERQRLERLGKVIRLYGAYLTLFENGLKLNSKDEVSIHERFENGKLSYEILQGKEKEREKEITIEQVLAI
jgi:hypothetical protein